jgi:tRNA threonylcarbamoyladenosine biosynthesis protein TsaB
MSGAWLAIDTATDAASAAVVHGTGGVTAEWLVGARRQASDLLPLVARMLSERDVTPRDLAGIVVGDGPGSFTGLRIGWALAKGMLQESGRPLVAVPSLLGHAWAAGTALGLGDRPVAACFDALRGQVFGAVYRDRRTAGVETLVAPMVATMDELAATGVRPALVVGSGGTRYPEAARAWSGAEPLALPPGAGAVAAALLALRDHGGVARPVTAADEPAYGRPAEAQARWEARHGRPLPPR